MNHDEQGYLDLLEDILKNGQDRKDRTGVGTVGTFGTQLRFSLENGKVPMLTTKKMFVRGIIEELLFFIRGDTDTKKLEEKGVNIWKGNTSREFLDKKGLTYLPEGSLGKGYGYQWRNFGGDEGGPSLRHPPTEGVDQLKDALNKIKFTPEDRRIIISAWNPQQLHEMALPPCHMICQFYVNNGKLSCQFYMRSVDMFLGLPFNIMSYAVFTHIMAATANLSPGELIFTGGDTHIYQNHLDQVREQISREPFDFPIMRINKKIETIEDMEALEFSDFEFSGYQSHPAIKAPMAI